MENFTYYRCDESTLRSNEKTVPQLVRLSKSFFNLINTSLICLLYAFTIWNIAICYFRPSDILYCSFTKNTVKHSKYRFLKNVHYDFLSLYYHALRLIKGKLRFLKRKFCLFLRKLHSLMGQFRLTNNNVRFIFPAFIKHLTKNASACIRPFWNVTM